MIRRPAPVRKRPSTVELRFNPPAPREAAVAPAGAPGPKTLTPAPRRKLVATRAPARSRPSPAPLAPAKAAAPAPTPAKAPAFAVAMASTTEVGATAGVPGGVPGGTGTGTGTALPTSGGGGGGGGGGYHPASELDVQAMPDVDTDACGRTITYPTDAEQAGIEGDVRLRVSLTETGRVHAVRVLSGLGHGLDRAAVDAISHRCRFKPAVAKDGKPVAFVIESYTFHFELPR